MRVSQLRLTGAALLAFAGCGGGGGSPTFAPVPAPSPTAAPSAPLLPSSAIFTASSQSTLPATAASPIPLTLPASNGFSGLLTLAIPANYPANATVNIVQTLSDDPTTLPPSVPALQGVTRAVRSRSTTAASSITTIAYTTIAASSTVQFPNAPSLTITIPAAEIVPNVSYRLASFDILRPSLGWQDAFEGPASVSGSTLTFAAPAPAVPFTITANVPALFGVYAEASSAAAPTPAPSISPNPAPSIAPIAVAPSSLSLLTLGATATAAITDGSSYSGGYAVSSSDTTIATVSISGKTLIVTGVAAGTATITVFDTQARSATASVAVTTTTLPLH